MYKSPGGSHKRETTPYAMAHGSKGGRILIRYVFKRLLWLIPVIVIVSFVVFALMDLAPGDIVNAMAPEGATPEMLAELRAQLGLDRPLIVRYASYMFGLIQGDLGVADTTGISVWDTYISRLPNTLLLSLGGLVVGASISVPMGIRAARKAGTLTDNITTGFTLVGMSMPGFWLGLLLLLLFSHQLGWVPAGGDRAGFRSFILPAICSGLMLMATSTRQTRSSMLEVLNSDYLRTARAKGVPEKTVIREHALGNAWIPILTTIGMSLSISLAGSAVIESVFAWPGVGRMLVEAVITRDVTMTTGTVIMTTIVYVFILLAVDLSYSLIDPRIKSQYVAAGKRRKSSGTIVRAPREPVPLPPEVKAAAIAERERIKTAAAQTAPAAPAATETAAAQTAPAAQAATEAPKVVAASSSEDSGELQISKYKKRGQFADIVVSLRRNKGAMAGLIILAAVVLTFLSSLFISFEAITAINMQGRLAPPSLQHPFGTDNLGRDLFLRVIYGTRYSLVIGFGATAIQMLFGVSLGAIAGFYGGKIDDILMRVSDTLASIPGMLLGIVIVTVLGQTLPNLIVAVGVTGIPIYMRITRASILSVRNQEFVEAARAVGLSNGRIIFRQVLPNGLAPILVTMTTSLGVMILVASGLSFLGFGVPVPHPEWGALIAGGRDFIRQAPWLTTFPGIFIMITVLSFNLIGDGLRDALDPKYRRRATRASRIKKRSVAKA